MKDASSLAKNETSADTSSGVPSLPTAELFASYTRGGQKASGIVMGWLATHVRVKGSLLQLIFL